MQRFLCPLTLGSTVKHVSGILTAAILKVAAILENDNIFSKYPSNNVFIEFLDLINIGLDTKITTLSYTEMELCILGVLLVVILENEIHIEKELLN